MFQHNFRYVYDLCPYKISLACSNDSLVTAINPEVHKSLAAAKCVH